MFCQIFYLHLIFAKYNGQSRLCVELCFFVRPLALYSPHDLCNVYSRTGVIGSHFPWLDCPAANSITRVTMVTEKTCMVFLWSVWAINMHGDILTGGLSVLVHRILPGREITWTLVYYFSLEWKPIAEWWDVYFAISVMTRKTQQRIFVTTPDKQHPNGVRENTRNTTPQYGVRENTR